MTCLGFIGEITEISRIGADEFSVEWQIRDFLSRPSDVEEFYYSPEFKLGDESWCFSIWPNWEVEASDATSVRLDVMRCDAGPAKTFRVSVGLRGTSLVEMMERSGIVEEFSHYAYYQWDDFCFRGYLIDHKSRLMPNDMLAVRCVLKNVDPHVTEEACFVARAPLWCGPIGCSLCSLRVNTALDASTQTSSPPEAKKSSGKKGQQSSGECVVCCEKAVDCVLYRCGHMCMCYDCAFKLRKSNVPAQCPVCRKSIKDVIKVYK